MNPLRSLLFRPGDSPEPGLSRKLWWVAALYFAQGFPYGLAYDLWPVYFRKHGVSLAEIGLMALLFLPYTLKATWAPLADRLGSRQSWIASCQLALALVTLLLLLLDPTRTDWVLWLVLLSFTTLSATQDISIDAYAIDISDPKSVGQINGVRASAWRVGVLTSGGGILSLASWPWFGWRGVWITFALISAALAVLVLLSPRIPRERAGKVEGVAPIAHLPWVRFGLALLFLALLTAAWQHDWKGWVLTVAVLAGTLLLVSLLGPEMLRWVVRPEMFPVLAFVLVFKLGDSTLGRMTKTFWVDRGYSEAEIGLISIGVGGYLTILGALLGGWFIARRGVFQGLVWMGLAQLVSNFGYVAIAGLELPRSSIYVASSIESLAQGMGTAAFLSFLMVICDRAHAATQYALLTATFALTRDVAGAFSGIGVENLGYLNFFWLTALIAVPGLLILPFLKGRIRDREGAIQPS